MAELKLCKGVELEPNYEHTFDFANATEQGEYFATKVYKTYDNFLLIKDRNASLFKGIIAKENYDYLKVPETLENVRECTYLFWNNGGVNDKTYYAFITNSYYLNENTTIIEYELDVMQTFLFDYQIESAYIAREHQDRMYEDTSGVDPVYRPIFNIMPENLNIGQDVIIKGNQKFCKTANFTGVTPIARPFVWVIITATDKLCDNDLPSCFLSNDNMYVYAIPYCIGESYTLADPLINTISIHDGTDYRNLWSYQALMAWWTTTDRQGELAKIHQISITSYLPSYDDLPISPTNVIFMNSDARKLWKCQKLTIPLLTNKDLYVLQLSQDFTVNETVHDSLLGELVDIKDTVDVSVTSPTMTPDIKYETKLNTYPYKYIQLSHNNQSLNLKYENIKNKGVYGKVNIYAYYSFLVYNKQYARETSATLENDDLGYNYGIASKPMNDLPLTTTAYLNYMLTRSAQAVTGVAIKNVAGAASIGAGIAMLSVPEPTAMTKIAGIGSIIGGVVSGAGAIADEVAKREDLKDTPATLDNMSNDGTFAIETKTCIPIAQYMEIKPEYMQQCYSYFRLFGYKANRLATPTYDGNGTIVSDNMNLKSRYYFNYIKCADINIELAYNRDYHDKIISIFKNGITFWHYRTGMGYNNFKPFNYRYENIEMSLL